DPEGRASRSPGRSPSSGARLVPQQGVDEPRDDGPDWRQEMLQKVMKDLRGDDIVAHDGEIGSVRDAYFDDEHWTVRYLVVDTGNWLPGRQVLISPASIAGVADGHVRVDLSRDQVEQAPGAEEQQPVSRLYEQSHALYYGYPYYW